MQSFFYPDKKCKFSSVCPEKLDVLSKTCIHNNLGLNSLSSSMLKSCNTLKAISPSMIFLYSLDAW